MSKTACGTDPDEKESMPGNARRTTCDQCLRPSRTCICRWIVPVPNTIEVLVLQHPLETGNAKGSARLLHLCLPHSRIVVGEVFAEQELRALLHAPFPAAGAGAASEPSSMDRQPILLYPDTPDTPGTPAMPSSGMREPKCGRHVPQEPYSRHPRLVVLDGTWRKSRKMLYLNPLLQQLPRLPLRNPPASQYRIRKAHDDHQLSTFEATCYALMQLERDADKYFPLLNAFSGFVTQQSAYRIQGTQGAQGSRGGHAGE